MTRRRQQRKNASKNIRRRKMPQRKLGFSAGVFLILLAFSLMGVRTVLDNLPLHNTSNQQQTNTATNSTTPETTTKTADQEPFPQQPAQLTLRQGTPTTNPTTKIDTNVNVPIRPHNPRKGASSASTKIIILGHLGCRPCRQSLRVALDYVRKHPITAQVVSKLALPQERSQAGMEAALFSYIAQEELVFWETLKHFDQTSQKAVPQISDTSSRLSSRPPSRTSSDAHSSKLENGHSNNQLLEALAAVGMPLAQIRTKLRNKTSLYMDYLEQDLQDLEDLNAKVLNKKNLPIVILNGKIIQPQPGTAPNKQLQAQLNALN